MELDDIFLSAWCSEETGWPYISLPPPISVVSTFLQWAHRDVPHPPCLFCLLLHEVILIFGFDHTWILIILCLRLQAANIDLKPDAVILMEVLVMVCSPISPQLFASGSFWVCVLQQLSSQKCEEEDCLSLGGIFMFIYTMPNKMWALQLGKTE